MTLESLEPKWIHPNVFTFLCPHCKRVRLTCKNAAMIMHDQFALFAKEYGERWNIDIVPADPDFIWTITGAMPDLTVRPSIDASASGHWHGHITGGEAL